METATLTPGQTNDSLDKIYAMLGYWGCPFGCAVVPGFIYFFVDGSLYRMLVRDKRAISITNVAKEWSFHRNSEFDTLLFRMEQELIQQPH